MPTIDLHGFQMYVDDRGEGEPLLLLHGGMGIGSDWRHVFPSDPTGYRVIVPDLRGHGRSTNPDRTFTFRQCADDVLALLEHLGLARVKDRKSTRLNSSHRTISYAVFCLKKKKHK